jgi:5-methyltetrahydropteroyltriglutamate--homocysteine methyltransferase
MSVYATNLGFPRIGRQRELKFALEKLWKGDLSEQELLTTAKRLRAEHWKIQTTAGIFRPPSNDFSFYDHVLDMAAMLGVVPARFGASSSAVSLATYFAMARGSKDAPALEMTKWFDTNYHYVVPEFEQGASYSLRSGKALDEYLEAKVLGIETRPVLLGPVSFVLLGKVTGDGIAKADVLRAILPLYVELLSQLREVGTEWVQLDEPCLTLDLDVDAERMYRESFMALHQEKDLPLLMLTTYFGDLAENLPLALELGTAGLHVDLVRAPKQLDELVLLAPKHLRLSLGLIDGRNVWRTDLRRVLSFVESRVAVLGKDRLEIAPSCSLLHVPFDLELETRLDPEVRSWMAFAKQKLEEVKLLAAAIEGDAKTEAPLRDNEVVMAARRLSPRIHRPNVAQRLAALDETMHSRENPYPIRRKKQQDELKLPLLPTTTIGSFPQTGEVRKMRAAFRSGKLDTAAYDSFLEEETARCIRFQERIGIDVLVHGEFERNDMVEYFGEQLDGFVFSEDGWVQSYGSRCVKPPIIFGDVQRPHPMTLRWTTYACSLTKRPVKGMLTGPVTILQWSFVRNDQPRSQTCRQIALAIRDEVVDLEAAGVRIIQIDEPAIREGLPLRRPDWPDYLDWSVNAFRLASSGVKDCTQIHTHMCYSEFNDIIDSIVHMDADVISIECSRSRMKLLDAFHRVRYPNEIGPGVYDIHSPRVPESSEIETLLRKALEVLTPEQLWVNPDCGLKTRGWPEVEQALVKMVEVAKKIRAALVGASSVRQNNGISNDGG